MFESYLSLPDIVVYLPVKQRLHGMKIRKEHKRDAEAVYHLNRSAFETSLEANLVNRLREEADPVISLIAEKDGRIAGHILFTPVSVADRSDINILVMGLAPMAVLPGLQKKGIGSALVKAGLEECKKIGAGAVVVLGHAGYYPKFGFRPAHLYGLHCEYDVPPEAFMILELQPGFLEKISGTVRYHDAFRSE